MTPLEKVKYLQNSMVNPLDFDENIIICSWSPTTISNEETFLQDFPVILTNPEEMLPRYDMYSEILNHTVACYLSRKG